MGGRDPLAWSYDTWNRPVEVTLPAGPGRSAGGPFAGFARSYDSLDRLTEVSGLGAPGLSPTAVGAVWGWGGADRLYAMTTKGALGTAARWGYHGGAGPQVPGSSPGLGVEAGDPDLGVGGERGADHGADHSVGRLGLRLAGERRRSRRRRQDRPPGAAADPGRAGAVCRAGLVVGLRRGGAALLRGVGGGRPPRPRAAGRERRRDLPLRLRGGRRAGADRARGLGRDRHAGDRRLRADRLPQRGGVHLRRGGPAAGGRPLRLPLGLARPAGDGDGQGRLAGRRWGRRARR